METSANLLTETVARSLPLLRTISAHQASTRPGTGKWSPKEVIGHLVDSANNNQQKFTRCIQAEEVHFPGYEQDEWVTAQHYNDAHREELLAL